MKMLTTKEKLTLIRQHGERISQLTYDDFADRAEFNACAQRVIELVKSIPKADLK